MRAKGRPPRSVPGGGLGVPKLSRPYADDATVQTIVTEAWLGRMSVGAFVFHAVTFSLNDDRLPVMHQPVDHGGGQGVVHVEDRAPVPEGSIGRDDDRAAFIPGGDDLEQQVRTAFVDGQIAQLIEEEKLRGGVLPGFFSSVPLICAVVSTLIMSTMRVNWTENPFSHAVCPNALRR